MMNTSRRSFIRNSSFLIAGTTLLSRAAFASSKPTEIMGLQLYSIRDDMQKNATGTLKQVAEIGYKNVEHAGYTDRKFYGYTAKEFKKLLDDLGLRMPCGHTVMGLNHWDAAKKDFTDAWKYTVEDAAIAGQQYVVSPWIDEAIRKDYDSMMQFLDLFNKSGELCKKSGMKFGYHNHWFEFTDQLKGTMIFDLMMKNIDFDLVAMQLDMGNMYIAGAKASDVLNQYPGKFELLHVKDEIPSSNAEKFESSVLGKGIINAKEATDLARRIGGTKIYIVEQEAYQNMTPLQAVEEDFRVMKQWGF